MGNMIMKNLLVPVLMSTTMQAFAQEEAQGKPEGSSLHLASTSRQNNVDSRPYLTLNIGGAHMRLPNSAFAVAINAGYELNRSLSVEGGITYLPSKQGGALSTYTIYDAAVKGTLPLGNIFALYGRAGFAIAYSEWSGSMCDPPIYQETGFAWNSGVLLGVGASFTLNHHVALRIEDYGYLPFSGNSGHFGNANVLTGGIQYKF